MTSHNIQLIKFFHVARNLASCELFPYSDRGGDGVILEHFIGGVLLTCLGVDGVDTSCVTVVRLPCSSAVVSDRVLPVVWTFRP